MRIPRFSLLYLVSVALATSVLLFASGSSSLVWLTNLGKDVKWYGLGVLLAFSVALAWQSKPKHLPFREIYVCGAVFVAIAFDSIAWSVEPAITWKRALSVLALATAVGAIGIAVSAQPQSASPLVGALVVAAALDVLGGFVLLAFDQARAVQGASQGQPARFRGLGQNPNTVSLLAAVVVPLAVVQLLRHRRRNFRVFWGICLALLVLATVVSGSRGALIAMCAGVIPFACIRGLVPRQRILVVAAAAGALVVGGGLMEVSILHAPPVPPTLTVAGQTAQPGQGTRGNGEKGGKGRGGVPSQPTPLTPNDGQVAGTAPHRLEDEIGVTAGGRTLLGSSGRAQAWFGALAIGEKRPVAGYGFGTEDNAFIDRWAAFQSSRPENSYLGLFLQLGAAGLLIAVIFVLLLVRVARGALQRGTVEERRLATACLGVVVAGGVLGSVESWLYAAGNIAGLAFWASVFLLVGLVGAQRTARV